MPGLNLFFCFLGDDSGRRWQILCPNVGQKIKLLRLLIFSRLKESNYERLPESDLNFRLFFNGQELDDQFCLKNYGINNDDLIQFTITSTSPIQRQFSNLEDDSEDPKQDQDDDDDGDPLRSKSYKNLQRDEYYEIGDHVDAFDPESCGWFPAFILQIKQQIITSSDDSSLSNCNYYYIGFKKQSLGTMVPKSLNYIRPQSYRIIERDDLKPGEMVMALNADGQWSVGAIDWIKRSKQNRSTRLWLTMVTEGENMPFVRQMIKYQRGNVLVLESNVKIDHRTEELNQVIKYGSKIDRKIEPDCSNCEDDPNESKCEQCGCQICHQKTEPDKQLACDECGLFTHFWCLKVPVSTVPKETDWYCDKCRNETHQQLMEKQQNHMKRNLGSDTSWGFGMTNVGKSPSNPNRPRSDIFGPIPQIPVGSWWRFRVQVAEAGVHAPLVAGIHGREQYGAYSLVYSAQNSQDIDLGEEIYYTANGGGVRKRKRNQRIQQQEFKTNDHSHNKLKREILALARNCPVEVDPIHGGHSGTLWQSGKPIRLLRNGNNNCRFNAKKSKLLKFLPKIGIRYDGLYKVVKYWPETGLNGHQVWRFLLRRDDPEPAPWTEAGRYQARKLGLTLQYPQGWCKEVAQKRSWKIDEKILKKQKLEKSEQTNKKNKRFKKDETEKNQQQYLEEQEVFQIPDQLKQLILLDELNCKTWCWIMETKPMTKQNFIDKVSKCFQCVCCMDQINDPITTDCGHNFCLECIQQILNDNDHEEEEEDDPKKCCPVCRKESFLTNQLKIANKNKNGSKKIKIIKTNTILEKILMIIKTL